MSRTLAAASVPVTSSNCLFVMDRSSRVNFLVDNGSDLSVFSRNLAKGRTQSCTYVLLAANGSEIPTYGCIMLNLNFGLRRQFQWHFVIANVWSPIIAAGFLSHFELLPDLFHGNLVHTLTGLHSVALKQTRDVLHSVKAIRKNHLLENRLGTRFQSNSSRSRRHPQYGSNNPVRPVRVPIHDVWTEERSPNIPTLHGRSYNRSRVRFCLYRRLTRSIDRRTTPHRAPNANFRTVGEVWTGH